MTTKLKVNAELKTALDSVLVDNKTWEKTEIIDMVVTKGGFHSSHRVPLNNMPINELIQAIYVGYELADPKGLALLTLGTPTDRNVDNLVKQFNNNSGHGIFSYQDGIRDGVRLALSTLDVKVTGINKR